MFRSGYYHKIFYTVILFIVINMMYYFIGMKKSTQVFFYNQAVFSNMFITRNSRMIGSIDINVFPFISFTSFPMVVIFSFIKKSCTFIRTKLSITYSITLKSLVALLASLNALTRLIVAFPATVAWIVRWRTFKLNSANFTNKYHNRIISYSMTGGDNE